MSISNLVLMRWQAQRVHERLVWRMELERKLRAIDHNGQLVGGCECGGCSGPIVDWFHLHGGIRSVSHSAEEVTDGPMPDASADTIYDWPPKTDTSGASGGGHGSMSCDQLKKDIENHQNIINWWTEFIAFCESMGSNCDLPRALTLLKANMDALDDAIKQVCAQRCDFAESVGCKYQV